MEPSTDDGFIPFCMLNANLKRILVNEEVEYDRQNNIYSHIAYCIRGCLIEETEGARTLGGLRHTSRKWRITVPESRTITVQPNPSQRIPSSGRYTLIGDKRGLFWVVGQVMDVENSARIRKVSNLEHSLFNSISILRQERIEYA